MRSKCSISPVSPSMNHDAKQAHEIAIATPADSTCEPKDDRKCHMMERRKEDAVSSWRTRERRRRKNMREGWEKRADPKSRNLCSPKKRLGLQRVCTRIPDSRNHSNTLTHTLYTRKTGSSLWTDDGECTCFSPSF